MSPPKDTAFDRDGPSRFLTTAWSVVMRAQDPTSAEYKRSVDELCARYWKPVYAFVRGRGWDAEEARDLTQEYFSRFLEKELFRKADRSRGRFRSFVLVTVERFLKDELDKRTRRRRAHEKMTEDRQKRSDAKVDPEEEFNKALGREIIGRVLASMRVHCDDSGQDRYYRIFTARVEAEAAGRPPSYDDMAAAHDMSVTDVTNALHRARQIFKRLLRDEIRHSVTRESEIDSEIADLRKWLS